MRGAAPWAPLRAAGRGNAEGPEAHGGSWGGAEGRDGTRNGRAFPEAGLRARPRRPRPAASTWQRWAVSPAARMR